MTITPIDHIALDERGIAYVNGTRLKVSDIVIDTDHWGLSPAEIQENHPRISLSQIHSALAYYHDHKAEIDGQIADDTREYELLRQASPNRLSRKDLDGRLGAVLD